MGSSNTRPRQPPKVRMVQNFHLVWLDESIDDEHNGDCRNFLMELRQIVNTINTFTDMDKCIDFINGMKEEKTFMISSGALGQTTVPVVHDKPQVNTIYILCENKTHHEDWAKQWPKIKGVFTDIKPICEALKQGTYDCEHNSVSISFVQKVAGSSNQNLDTLDQSFMYTQILKEILITIDFEQSHINDFLSYCRTELAENPSELKNVDKIAKEYRCHQPIWWYTYGSFLYSMLNRALRVMEVDQIIKMGFFLRDLHQHIATLHTKQFNEQRHSDSFTVYRGQGLSQTEFDQFQNMQDGLIAFNSFLSTSTDRNVSLNFAQQMVSDPNLISVLFVMKVNPSISTTPFANIAGVSYYESEKEILFSMHSIFRIGQVQQIEGNNRLYEVNLTLTSDTDPQLQALTKSMQEETFSGYKGWLRLGMLMIKLGHFNKAEELYNILFEQTNDKGEKAHLYHMLGMVNDSQEKYTEAVQCYENSIKINQKILSPTHSDLTASYSNIGLVYNHMGEYSKALSYFEKALGILQKSLPVDHPHSSTSKNNIGVAYRNMREYSKAVKVRQKTLSTNLPVTLSELATCYNNIGLVYDHMGEYSKALSYYEKALEIDQTTLLANHPDLATSYNNISLVYDNMGEYSKALSYYEKALEILQKTLPTNHPHLATSYNNIGSVYEKMGEYSKTLVYYEKALKIFEKILPANHLNLATSYNNIGSVYEKTGEYSKALSYYERALDIRQCSLPFNDPDSIYVKKSIEIVKKKLLTT